MSKALADEAKEWRTGKFQIGDAPNPHGLLYEHIKTVATISIAFLGFSVGYAEKLVTVAKFEWATQALGIVWGLLVFSIVCVLWGSVELHKYLLKAPEDPTDAKQQKSYKWKHNRAVTLIGLAGSALVFASISFAFFGWGVMSYSNQQIGASAAIKNATSFLLNTFPQSQWTVESLAWDDQLKGYKTVFVDGNSKTRHFVVVNKESGEAVNFGKGP